MSDTANADDVNEPRQDAEGAAGARAVNGDGAEDSGGDGNADEGGSNGCGSDAEGGANGADVESSVGAGSTKGAAKGKTKARCSFRPHLALPRAARLMPKWNRLPQLELLPRLMCAWLASKI